MNTNRALATGLMLSCLQACAGRAIDLDQGRNLSTSGGASSGIETINLSDSVGAPQVDESRVFWVTPTGTAQSCEYDTCGVTKVAYGAVSGDIVLGAREVYFKFNPYSAGGPTGRFAACLKSGCVGEPQKLFVDDMAPYLGSSCPPGTVDDKYFYWPSSFDIYRCALSGCGEVPEVVAKNESSLDGLIVDGNDIFWMKYGEPADRDEVIRSAPKDGSRPPRTVGGGVGLSSGFYGSSHFAVDPTKVYWLDDSSRVQSCPRTGCNGQEPLTLVATTGVKRSLHVDATRLYWLETSESFLIPWTQGTLAVHASIRSCPITGCAPGTEPEILTPDKVGDFAMNSRYLYWTEPEVLGDPPFYLGDSKQIFRRAKP